MRALPKFTPEFQGFRKPFEAWLVANGSAVLAKTNPYEVLRFTTEFGVGIIYRNKKEELSFVNGADTAVLAFRNLQPWRAREKVARNKRKQQITIDSLLQRDGDSCTFCGKSIALDEISVEHFVPLTSGGPDELANMCLAHQKCNMDAGHKSVREKIEMIVKLRTEHGR